MESALHRPAGLLSFDAHLFKFNCIDAHQLSLDTIETPKTQVPNLTHTSETSTCTVEKGGRISLARLTGLQQVAIMSCSLLSSFTFLPFSFFHCNADYADSSDAADGSEPSDADNEKGVAVLCLSAVFSSAMLVLFLHRQRKARGGKKLLRLMLIIIASRNMRPDDDILALLKPITYCHHYHQ